MKGNAWEWCSCTWTLYEYSIMVSPRNMKRRIVSVAPGFRETASQAAVNARL